MHQEQLDKVRAGKGFIAALDQSGGSTPKALKLYGVDEDAYDGEAEMFDRIHEMRTRIVASPSFSGDRVLGAILFEQTMDRQIDGRDTPAYLWEVKGVVPFLKVDKGLEDAADGVQLMKPMPGLDELLERAVAKGVFGTKMRSVVQLADPDGRPSDRRPAVRGGTADPRPRPGTDPRARGRHQEPPEGRRGGAAQGGAAGRARLPPRGAAGDVQAHPPGRGRLLRRPRRAPEGRQGRGPLRWLHAGTRPTTASPGTRG